MAKPTTPRAVILLLKLDFRRLGGWNEFVHTRDAKLRRRWLGLALVWVLLVCLVLFYLTAMAVGMAQFGLIRYLPGCLYTGTGAALLIYETLRAGSTIFSPEFRERTAPLPLPQAALPLSRLAGLYLCDLALCVLLLGPGLILYALTEHPGLVFWIAALWGLLLAPLLPLASACGLGMLAALLVRRLRHKNLMAGLLLVAFTMGILVWSMSLTSLPADADGADLMAMMAPALTAAASGYPPAFWFGQILTGGPGSLTALGLLSLVSLAPAALAVWLIVANYARLCEALTRGGGRRRAAREAGAHSLLTALYLREVRQYFSCTNWFANTVVGYLLMALFPPLLLFGGSQVLQSLELTPETVGLFLPVILGLMAVLMPVTSCSISMEGAQWPLVRTLPVRTRDLLLAKIILNLTIALPCWGVAVIGGVLAVRPQGLAVLWLVLVPALYCVFGAVAALRINLAFPQLHWQTETQAVKQSAAVLLSMLAGFAAAGVPWVCLLFFPANNVYAVLCPILVVLTGLLWRQSLHVNLQKIQ